MEQGMDTKSLMEEYLKVKKELDQIRNILRTKDAKHQGKINKYKKKLKDALDMLKKQQEEVTKPLLSELKIKDILAERMKKK